jgi:ABC-type amino acid transport substrate-binding protein
MRRVWQLRFAVVPAVLWLASCATTPISSPGGESASDAALNSKTLRIGVAPLYPPLAFTRGGDVVGVEADMAKALGDDLQRGIEIVVLEPDDLIPALLERRVDILMSGLTITDTRVQQVTFAHPYLRVGQMAVVRRAEAGKFRGAAALNQPRLEIGVVAASSGEAIVRNRLPRAQRSVFPAADAAVAALRNGDIDAVVMDASSVWRLTGGVEAPELQLTSNYDLLSEEYLAWAVRKSDTGLRDLLDTMLQQWNSSGKLEQLLRPWLQVRRSAPVQAKGQP